MKIIVDLFNQHSGDFGLLKRMILESWEAGADFVKIQLLDSQRIWGDDSRKYLELSEKQFFELSDFSKTLGIPLLATAFSEETFEWIDSINPDFHKIASVTAKKELNLCKRILGSGKPTFVSNGLDNQSTPFSEYENVINFFCVSEYPTLPSSKSLQNFPMEFSSKDFLGYSDHTIGNTLALIAGSRGCQFLEKHFTFSQSFQRANELGHSGAMDKCQLRSLRIQIEELKILQQYKVI
jgi:sialic acid synthase SpsE